MINRRRRRQNQHCLCSTAAPSFERTLLSPAPKRLCQKSCDIYSVQLGGPEAPICATSTAVNFPKIMLVTQLPQVESDTALALTAIGNISAG